MLIRNAGHGIFVSSLGMLALGCGGPDERLAEFARQSNQQQAAQSERVASANVETAQAGRRLIEADAQARSDLIALQHDLRSDQADVGRQRDRLELERQAIARERQHDSMMGSGLVALGLLMACLSPLLLAAASLAGLFTEPTAAELDEALADELVLSSRVSCHSPTETLAAANTADEQRHLPF